MRHFLIFLLIPLFLTGCFREVEDPASVHPSQRIDATPNYEATATKIIVDATATAVGFLDADCLPQESTRWLITLLLSASGESIDEANSHARNQTYRNNWLCEGQLALDHQEYEIEVVYEGEAGAIDFLDLADEIVLWLLDNPPDSLPDTEALVLIRFHRGDASFEEMVANAFSWEFSYSQAIAAYDLGLRGADLAEALGVHVP